MLSLVSNRQDYWQAVLVVAGAFAIMNLVTSLRWGWIPALVLLLTVIIRAWWDAMPSWLLLLAALVPVLVAEAAAVGNAGFMVVVVVLAGVAAEKVDLPTRVLIGVALLSPIGLWVARVDDYVELGPWIWTAGLLLGWLFGAVIGRLWELVDALEESRAQLAESAARQERNRIARELHDLVGHNFSVVLLHLAGARSILHRSPDEAEEALRKAEEVGREGMNDLREALTLMRAGTPFGAPVETAAALSDLVDRYRGAGLDVLVDVDGPIDALATTSALVVQDVARECLTNAAKHAPSQVVQLHVSVGSDVVCLTAENTVDRLPARGASDGYGLIGLRERVESIGGRFEAGVHDVDTTRRWRVAATIPRSLERVDGTVELAR